MPTATRPTVLLTGGTGYIGSHTAVALLDAGYPVVLYDNLCNSRADVVDHIAAVAGTRQAFVHGDKGCGTAAKQPHSPRSQRIKPNPLQ